MTYKNRSSEEGGFVVVLVALVLVVLLAFVALGVDSGILYSARASAQEAGDAAALAGAYTFITSPTAPQPATAIAHAKAVAATYTILGSPVLPADVTVNVDSGTRRVTVDVQAMQKTYFAKAIGIRNANIATHSAGEAGLHADKAPSPKPFFLPNTILSAMDACDACNAGGQSLIDPMTGDVTSYGKARLGTWMSLKPSDPKGAVKPSSFYLIDFNDGDGGSKEINGWIDGSIPVPPVACGQMLEVEKGNKVGMKSGLEDLLGNPPDDTYQDVGQYLVKGINGINVTALSDSSKALVSVPIWDTCGSGFCASGIPKVKGGHQQIEVLGFAAVFLESITGSGNKATLTLRLINISGCDATPGPSGSSVVGGFPLRLVHQ